MSNVFLFYFSKSWQGLTVFVDYPEIPMDNNQAERRLRNPALSRNNYYGRHSETAGQFAAMQFSIIQTCLLHKINPYAYLIYCLNAGAKRGNHQKISKIIFRMSSNKKRFQAIL